ncbi:hypothetical protein CBOM_00715 [Ceraceosorus bombacis]|uniref:Histidine-rich glycoprotein-like n=1 Tax=Ceraceosorus bombacis TaxID=401625 RepID=A0A0P1BAU0_9BASI|nr:hypothetical protein CBOM_00715 [Ceraceosorus bombacis]
MRLNKSLASLAALLALVMVASAHPVIPRSFELAMAEAMHEDELASRHESGAAHLDAEYDLHRRYAYGEDEHHPSEGRHDYPEIEHLHGRHEYYEDHSGGLHHREHHDARYETSTARSHGQMEHERLEEERAHHIDDHELHLRDLLPLHERSAEELDKVVRKHIPHEKLEQLVERSTEDWKGAEGGSTSEEGDTEDQGGRRKEQQQHLNAEEHHWKRGKEADELAALVQDDDKGEKHEKHAHSLAGNLSEEDRNRRATEHQRHKRHEHIEENAERGKEHRDGHVKRHFSEHEVHKPHHAETHHVAENNRRHEAGHEGLHRHKDHSNAHHVHHGELDDHANSLHERSHGNDGVEQAHRVHQRHHNDAHQAEETDRRQEAADEELHRRKDHSDADDAHHRELSEHVDDLHERSWDDGEDHHMHRRHVSRSDAHHLAERDEEEKHWYLRDSYPHLRAADEELHESQRRRRSLSKPSMGTRRKRGAYGSSYDVPIPLHKRSRAAHLSFFKLKQRRALF